MIARLILAATLLLVGAASALADFVFEDFSSVGDLQLNGAAAQSGAVLRVTPATEFASGSVFTSSETPVGDQASFSTYFQFRISNSAGIGDADGAGADGLVFVVQTVGNSVGGAGGGIGYEGIDPSLGIEFDTFENFEFSDPSGNHVGVDLGGDLASIDTALEPEPFNNGRVWNVWIDYDGPANALEARWSLDPIRPSAPQLSSVLNLLDILSAESAFVGFTSGTGSGFGDHDILSWEFRSRFDPIEREIPEPPSAATGLVLVACLAASWVPVSRGGGLAAIG